MCLYKYKYIAGHVSGIYVSDTSKNHLISWFKYNVRI